MSIHGSEVVQADEVIRAAEIGATLSRFNTAPEKFINEWCDDPTLLARYVTDPGKYFYSIIVEAVGNYSQVHCPHCGVKRK